MPHSQQWGDHTSESAGHQVYACRKSCNMSCNMTRPRNMWCNMKKAHKMTIPRNTCRHGKRITTCHTTTTCHRPSRLRCQRLPRIEPLSIERTILPLSSRHKSARPLLVPHQHQPPAAHSIQGAGTKRGTSRKAENRLMTRRQQGTFSTRKQEGTFLMTRKQQGAFSTTPTT